MNCGAELTSIRPHLALHFQKLLQQKNASKDTKIQKRVQPYYSEALTNDEVIERLQEERKSSKGPSKKKRCQTPPSEDDGKASTTRGVDHCEEADSHDEGTYIDKKHPKMHIFGIACCM